jgi:glycosyltransferase involved in cell wall biosynthesis
MLRHPIFFAGEPGSAYGWGICNRHLFEELSKLTRVEPVYEAGSVKTEGTLPGHLFTPLGDHHLEATTPLRGLFNHGYTFFENELDDSSVKNAAGLDTIFAGCSWCRDKLAERGIESTVLVQGVDPKIFQPIENLGRGKLFIVFSGGKFEYRKGQDIVLRAVQRLQRKYPDIVLINAWANRWVYSLETMKRSPHITYAFSGDTWQEVMKRLYALNGIDDKRIVTMPLVSQIDLAKACHLSSIGVFPNRCEGGTNLVMMEYMACGKPVVASYATGHCDVLTERNAYLLRKLKPLELKDEQGRVFARWVEPDLDELTAQIEHAYLSREETALKGRQAALDMAGWTWKRSAETVVETLLRFEAKQKAPA